MKKELWLRLQHYHFDNLVPTHLLDQVAAAFGRSDASTTAFASKLSRKLGWTLAYARRSIAEYKKFLYLGVVSDFPVTPSKAIDQVWHEHLLFSRGYREFCRDILRRDFDHNPELVPLDDQTSAFKAQYEATLALYRTEFHMAPPPDIWGTPKFLDDPTLAGAPLRRKTVDGSGATTDAAPLYLLLATPGTTDGSSHDGTGEFGGGGGFSGGGGGSSWGDPGTHDASSATDSSDGGGSADGGGSSCSSGCGGGE